MVKKTLQQYVDLVNKMGGGKITLKPVRSRFPKPPKYKPLTIKK